MSPGQLAEEDIVAGQALAAVATIAILQQRVVFDARLVNDQLSNALTSRIVIEQAKGVVAERAERAGLTMEAAFNAMRHHARQHDLRLVDVAGRAIDKTLSPEALTGGWRP